MASARAWRWSCFRRRVRLRGSASGKRRYRARHERRGGGGGIPGSGHAWRIGAGPVAQPCRRNRRDGLGGSGANDRRPPRFRLQSWPDLANAAPRGPEPADSLIRSPPAEMHGIGELQDLVRSGRASCFAQAVGTWQRLTDITWRGRFAPGRARAHRSRVGCFWVPLPECSRRACYERARGES
jgi:hypothetical protein